MAKQNASAQNTVNRFIKFIKHSWIFTIIISFGVGLAIMGIIQPPPPTPSIVVKKTDAEISITESSSPPSPYTVDQLTSGLTKAGFNLQNMEDNLVEIPRFWPEAVPKDLNSIEPVGDRKKIFMSMMLPIVLMVNERISRDRVRLLAI